MSHPFEHLRQSKVEKSRVSKIAHRATGGRVEASQDVAGMKRKEAAVSHATKTVNSEGSAPKHRADRPGRKRGGRVKGKGGKTVVNVNIAPQAPAPAGPPIGPGGLAAKPPMPMPPPPGPPPGAPPPGAIGPGPAGPGPMPPMRKAGGRVNSGTKVFNAARAEGTQVTHTPGKNDTDDMRRPHMKMKPKVVTFATGGGVKSFKTYPKMSAGAETGQGRIQKAKDAKRRG